MNRLCALTGIAALVGFLATPAQAAPIQGDSLIASGGDVVVTFLSTRAGYSNDLLLDGAFGDELGVIFNNRTSAVGASMNLGSFAKGTELVFKLFVHDTGDVFYTGDSSRNRDGVAHALLTYDDGPTPVWRVGFEDLIDGGDRDYNDLVFGFTSILNVANTNVSAVGDSGSVQAAAVVQPAAEVDEPANLLLLGTGLAMLVFAIRRPAVRS